MHQKELGSKAGKASMLSSRTFCSAIDPRLHQKPGCLLVTRSGIAAFTGIPSPSNQIVLCDVLLQSRQITAAIQFNVFQLQANLTQGLILPSHRQGSKSPPRVTRNASITSGVTKRLIVFGMAPGAGGFEMPGFCAPDRRHMIVLVVSLQWMIASGMTIHASRVGRTVPISSKIARERSAVFVIDRK